MNLVLPSWPSSLPSLSRRQYQWSPNNSFVRTQMESGPARQRRIFRHAPHLLSALWHFTPTELKTFESFYAHTLQSGSAWFTLSIWNGSGLADRNVRFIAPYQAKLLSVLLCEVSAELEIDQPNILAPTATASTLSHPTNDPSQGEGS